MNPITLIPTPYRILALSVAVSLLIAAVYAVGRSHGSDSVHAQWDKAKAAHIAEALEAEQAARYIEQAYQKKLNEAQNEAKKRETKLRSDADASRTAASGLRDTITALRSQMPGDTASACRITADTALAVFGECVDRYRSMAETADRFASDVKTLTDSWPVK